MPHRWMFMLSTVLAALVLAAMPVMALASDDCDDDDCDDQPPAAVVTPAPPVPAQPPTQELTTVPSPTAPAPAPVHKIRGERVSSHVTPKKATKHKTVHRQTTKPVVRVRRAAVSLQTIPQGGVQAGAGGTAPAGPDELVFALAGGSLVLLTAGGGLLARARRQDG